MRSLSKSSCLSRLKEAYRLSPLARHDPAKEYSGRNVPTRQGRICTTHFTDRYQTAVGVVHIQSGFLIRRYAPDGQPAFGERGFQFRPTAFRLDRLDSRQTVHTHLHFAIHSEPSTAYARTVTMPSSLAVRSPLALIVAMSFPSATCQFRRCTVVFNG